MYLLMSIWTFKFLSHMVCVTEQTLPQPLNHRCDSEADLVPIGRKMHSYQPEMEPDTFSSYGISHSKKKGNRKLTSQFAKTT